MGWGGGCQLRRGLERLAEADYTDGVSVPAGVGGSALHRPLVKGHEENGGV